MSRRIWRFPRYRLKTLFAFVTLLSVPLAFLAERERQYRARLSCVRTLAGADGGGPVMVGPLVVVEREGAGPDSQRYVYATDATFERDEIVVEAHCYASESNVAALLLLPTLRKLFLYDVPTGRLIDLPIEVRPGATDEEIKVARMYGRAVPEPRPLGSIDGALRRISVLPRLEELYLGGSVSDAGVAHLGALRSLRKLNLRCTGLSDAALAHLQSLRELEDLNLQFTAVSDKGVRCLGALPLLRVLELDNTKTTGTAFEAFAPDCRLERLGLRGAPVTDDGARHIASLGSLQFLNLDDTRITGRALKDLSRLSELRWISLRGDDDIGDDSLGYLARLPRLAGIDLVGTKVSDAGLVRLAAIASLRGVCVDRAKRVTAAGVLERLRPDVQVSCPPAETRGTGRLGAGSWQAKPLP